MRNDDDDDDDYPPVHRSGNAAGERGAGVCKRYDDPGSH